MTCVPLFCQVKLSFLFLFKNLLKPGGKLFVTDYCCGPKPWTTEFSEYVDHRGYTLLTPDEYGNLFTILGYSNVKATDRTDLFLHYLHCELSKFSAIKENFVKVSRLSLLFVHFQTFGPRKCWDLRMGKNPQFQNFWDGAAALCPQSPNVCLLSKCLRTVSCEFYVHFFCRNFQSRTMTIWLKAGMRK